MVDLILQQKKFLINIEEALMRACARNFLTLKNGISYLSLAKWSERALQLALRPFLELRSDLRSGSISGVALRPRSGFSERRSGAPLRGARRSNALLITLFDRMIQIFKNSPKCTIFAFLINFFLLKM